jgi:hypothetical protein
MRDVDWKSFFLVCRKILGKGSPDPLESESWCAWTTFRAIKEGIHYWYCGIPDFCEILDTHIADGGTWGQPFEYDDLAHVIVLASFYWETRGAPGFHSGLKHQAIEKVSLHLNELGIAHRKTEHVVEVKLY